MVLVIIIRDIWSTFFTSDTDADIWCLVSADTIQYRETGELT